MTRAQLRELSRWMAAIAAAHNQGHFCAYHEGQSMAMDLWCAAFDSSNDVDRSTELVKRWAQSHGVDPKVHKSGRIG